MTVGTGMEGIGTEGHKDGEHMDGGHRDGWAQGRRTQNTDVHTHSPVTCVFLSDRSSNCALFSTAH